MNTPTSPEGLILVRGIQILFFVVLFDLWHADSAQQRSRCTFSQGVASHYGQLSPYILNFKNEHLIFGELKVDNFSFQSYT